MFILENITLKKAVATLSIVTISLLTTACSTSNRSVDGAVKYDIKDGKYTAYHVNTQKVGKFNNGRTPTKTELAAWNIDVMPDGTGLPEYDAKNGKIVLDEEGNPKKAEGSVEWGNELYDSQCAMCHGEFGTGGKGYPTLSAGTASTDSLKNQLLNPADKNPGIEPPVKTIGTYWPYASTLFWYIQDAMPFPHPKSLSNSETYALVAYLLMENGVSIDGEELDDEYVLDREKFLKIKMPNEDGFYPKVDTPENPKQGVANMKAFLSDPKNYGTGTRCMNDCIKGEVPVLAIKHELNDFNPPASTERSWKVPGAKEVSQAQKDYETYCAACHANDAIGAPVLGNKEAWAEIAAQGMDTVYANAINGINAMPPKGGSDLSDADFKKVVDFMINSSK
ncbi:c-type cytochrome [Halarcobacter anaerophilus]|uniref:Sulfur oxidation protein SoxCD n=1 Tax=Halarcobacter anaerophilus TaxID=877500 RepID=A0A4Q0Y111_9BACT|nr:c-type cytochrome [Halarcobacter anaerophilus]QDF29109.1 sulfur oxidation protein SoxCD, diheme cytochrome c subunit [Halarcobacter anaerophilus]RXJ63737.1 sulfur oxidation protein SoxCD [Halarcobacter anaerophilus]